MTKRISIFIASLVLGTSLMGSAAFAAIPMSDTTSIASVTTDSAQVVAKDGTRPVKGDHKDRHHRRFCEKLNDVLTRLVANNTITREQKEKIMTAFDCDRDPNATTTTPAAAPTAKP